jgi:hypothetical protein
MAISVSELGIWITTSCDEKFKDNNGNRHKERAPSYARGVEEILDQRGL